MFLSPAFPEGTFLRLKSWPGNERSLQIATVLIQRRTAQNVQQIDALPLSSPQFSYRHGST